MFQEILTKTYYGNTVAAWGKALLIILAAVVVAKALYWLTKNVLRRLTKKTKTRLDDILVDMVEEPMVFIVAVGGAWYGLESLSFGEGVRDFLGDVFQVLIALAVTWLVARLIDSLFREFLVPLTAKTETDFDDQILPIIRKGTKLSIWILGTIVALNNAGYDVAALLAGVGIGGLAVAMAARDTVSNVFGGFTIFTDRPFSLNDRVKVAGFDGTVKEIGIRSTRLQTLEGRVVTIPNSTFAESPLENISMEPSRKVVLNLGLTYDTSAEKMEEAMATLREIAAADPDLEEGALVSFNAFGDFAMNILFIYYIKKGADILGAQTRINLAILREFNARGLEFAFPTQTIYTLPGAAGGEAQGAAAS